MIKGIDQVFEEQVLTQPEHILWLAVIERAMMDYLWPEHNLSVEFRNNLYPFFFEDTSKPTNLVYICDVLFDYPDAVKVIRKRLHELKNKLSPEEQIMRKSRFRVYI